MAKISELSTDELVKLFVQIRDQKAVEAKAWSTREDDLKSKLEKIGAVLLARYNELGIESARTQFGTAFKDKVAFASVGDRDVFFDFVFNQNAREFLEARVSKEAVKQYIAEHNDLPPGVNWREEVHIKVRRA